MKRKIGFELALFNHRRNEVKIQLEDVVQDIDLSKAIITSRTSRSLSVESVVRNIRIDEVTPNSSNNVTEYSMFSEFKNSKKPLKTLKS